MRIIDQIGSIFKRKANVIARKSGFGFMGNLKTSTLSFADPIFLNMVQLITDLYNDVEVQLKAGDAALFSGFKQFFYTYGQQVMDMYYRDGVVVVGHSKVGEGDTAKHIFRILRNTEYTTKGNYNDIEVIPKASAREWDIYLMVSTTYRLCNKSDRQLLDPFLQLIDNVLNGTNTIAARLGSVVFATPKTPSGASAATPLLDMEKKELEKQIKEGYGALDTQSQICLFSNDLSFTTINLAGLDNKMTEKIKVAASVIADRLKVPANQSSLIDSNSSKSLANGTELREGDFNKYQTFERLFKHTFMEMAEDMGLSISYTIANKPQRTQVAV